MTQAAISGELDETVFRKSHSFLPTGLDCPLICGRSKSAGIVHHQETSAILFIMERSLCLHFDYLLYSSLPKVLAK